MNAIVLCLLASCLLPTTDEVTAADDRLESWKQHELMREESLFSSLKWEGVGPRFCGGRIESVAVHPDRPATMYVGVGAGGLWKTVNSGITWQPIFEQEATMTVGDVTIAKSDPNTIWLGTGEVLLSRSAMPGMGVYKSTDAGETWTNVGLPDSQHIARVIIHPSDQNTVFVAVIGHQNSANEQRGVFRTSDGGNSWEKVLYVNDHTSAIDLTMAPDDPNTLYACMWERAVEGQNHYGAESGLYKTTDGGKTWKRQEGGLPSGDNVGRIAVHVAPSNPKVVYALCDEGRRDGLYRSDDRGETYVKVNDEIRGQWDWCEIQVSPDNEDEIYSISQKSYVSRDGGKNFQRVRGKVVHLLQQGATEIHDDTHEIWINPEDSEHLIFGTDGGLYVTQDRCKTWFHLNNLPISECYALSYDTAKPYNIYMGTQDNGALFGPHTHHPRDGRAEGWQYVFLSTTGGADSYFTYRDPTDEDVIYYEHQHGGMMRKDMKRGRAKSIKPSIEGERLRFAWMTPFFPSRHNGSTLYAGANRVFKSTDRGDSWTPISENLVTEDAVKNLRYRAITTLRESPLQAGLLFAGTDNGDLYVSINDGDDWQSINSGLPKRFVTRVYPSPHDSERVFVSFSGAGIDDFTAYLFRSDDLGKTWREVSRGLPMEPVNVVYEDPLVPNLIYAGTDLGIYSSLDGGASWNSLCSNLPTASVYDLFVHPGQGHLVIGTHGRSCYLADVTPIHEKAKRSQAMVPVSTKSEPTTVASRKERRDIELPARVDNSERKYFPPVSKQRWSTCSQESAIHYIFTYEMNYRRNADASRTENQYPATWAWNFVNNGRNQGSEVVEGWHVASRMGVPSVADYGKSGSKGTSGWMSGYERYYRSMKNRVKSWEFFKVTDEGGLEKAKRWLFNHDDPELAVGGLLAFDFPPSGHSTSKIPAGHYESGKTIVRSWGRGGGHLMTYVGYDDNVGFDFNRDGKITNDLDITGDDKVTIADWERGCFIMMNSWGNRFGQRGKAYVPYRAHFVQKNWSRGHWLASINVDPDYQPRMTLRVDLSSKERSSVRLRLSVLDDSADDDSRLVSKFEPLPFSGEPIFDDRGIKGPEGYSSFLSPGRATGRLPMQGKERSPEIEMGFDVSELFEDVQATEQGKLRLDFSLANKRRESIAELNNAAILLYDSDGKLLKTVEFKLEKTQVSSGEDQEGSNRLEVAIPLGELKLQEMQPDVARSP
ncbi:MAG: hypothetical protein MPJ50_14380 [Pirellulales bacterium]|nr:hypothetical protein [Pirellulales bacterium]